MTEPSLAVQIAIRDRLVATPAVTNRVAPERIIDGNARPENFPTIIIGDGQTVLVGFCGSFRTVTVYADAHIWTVESGLETVKEIAGVVADALVSPPNIPGFMVHSFRVTGTRYMRDPSKANGHAVLTVEAEIGELL